MNGDTFTKDAAVDIIGGDCSVADLPHHRMWHVSFVSPDLLVMVCGGWDLEDVLLASCLQYNLAE